jgi:UDP-N-acetylglucosamine transferase subunit ALG13
MIFVTVGSSSIPFDRLLRGVDATSFDEQVVVQHGASLIRPQRAECVDFLDYEDFVEFVDRARVVVTHAGVGSIMAALARGKRPIVVPRRSSYAEAVDDHQVPFARRADDLGLVRMVEDLDRLASAIEDHASEAPPLASSRSPLEDALRSYIEECVGQRTPFAMRERSPV